MCIRDSFTKKEVDENYEMKIGVENSGETDKLNVNKDDKVSSGKNYDNRSKNMVRESKGVNIGSTDESNFSVC